MNNNEGLNPVINKFYHSILDYAGLKAEDGVITNINEKIGEITIDDKPLALPYFNILKNPNGKLIFHPLNENYTNPETSIFNFYKRRLTLEINTRLAALIVNLLTLASDVQMQQKVKSSKLVDIVSNMGEVDLSILESFMTALKSSRKNNNEAFILDIFLKKNGSIGDTPYPAIGKINFLMYNEISKSLEDKDRDYKVFGYKLRKKDLLVFNNIFNIIFTDISQKDVYVEGTDNKIFRYLNILIKTSYLITNRINEIIKLLNAVKEPALNMDEFVFNHEWTKTLEDLYAMPAEIRIIPNQDDVRVESTKLRVNESKAAVEQAPNAPQYIPQTQQVVQPQVVQQVMPQPTQQAPLSPEDIIKGTMGYSGGMMPQHMMMQPMMQQPMMMQPPMATPQWIQQELVRTGVNPQQQMIQPMMQQPMMQQPMMQQPQFQQPMMQQPLFQQPMMQQQPMMGTNQGLQINPQMLGRNRQPWE